eukprot:3456976-Rhodomonas_salina.1
MRAQRWGLQDVGMGNETSGLEGVSVTALSRRVWGCRGGADVRGCGGQEPRSLLRRISVTTRTESEGLPGGGRADHGERGRKRIGRREGEGEGGKGERGGEEGREGAGSVPIG